MKNTFIILFLFFQILVSFAQNKALDVIYPIHGNDSIADCHIIKIRNGNLIYYQYMGQEDTIRAIAVVKKGEYIDFRTYDEVLNNSFPQLEPGVTKLSDYAYYSDLYYKSKEKKERGITFTAFGVVLSGVSIVIVAKQKVYSNANIIMGSAAYIVGGVFINVGIPKWISNTVKENNNRAAMETCRKSNISLNYGITENGIGLILKF